MKKRLVLIFFIFLNASFTISVMAQSKQFKALLVTTTNGWHHESIHYGVVALKQLSIKKNFDLIVFENPASFTDKELEQYQVIIFLSTTGNIFDSAQKKVMERFIQSGKGFVGIHSASDTEYDWDWYTKMVGRMFHIHPIIQTAKLNVIDNNFPGLQGLAKRQMWTDEWYEFGPDKITGLKNILTVDESSYNPIVSWPEKKVSGTGMGKVHPIAWYHEYDGGRAFYTALGHIPALYSEDVFLEHLYGGIYFAAMGKSN
jgi:uncharacterized protein